VADAYGAGGGDIEAEADEQAAVVAAAGLAALRKANVRSVPKADKQQEQPGGQQDTDTDELDQRPTAKHKRQAPRQQQDQQAPPKQRHKGTGSSARKSKGVASGSGDGDSYVSEAGSGSDSDTGSAQSLALSFASSTAGESDSSSSRSGGGGGGWDSSDCESEALQPCWGAAAGAQQLLEPGLAWASGACAAAALQQVPKPAILAAVGELVLRVEEEMARQAAARQHGVQQVRDLS
jgi:hypothetical protein